MCEIHSTLACALVGKTPPTAYAGDARENFRPRSQSLGGCFAAVDHSGYPARVVFLLCPRLWRLHEYRQHCGGREQARLAELLWVRLSLHSVFLEGLSPRGVHLLAICLFTAPGSELRLAEIQQLDVQVIESACERPAICKLLLLDIGAVCLGHLSNFPDVTSALHFCRWQKP